MSRSPEPQWREQLHWPSPACPRCSVCHWRHQSPRGSGRTQWPWLEGTYISWGFWESAESGGTGHWRIHSWKRNTGECKYTETTMATQSIQTSDSNSQSIQRSCWWLETFRDHTGDSNHLEITLVTQSIQGSHQWLKAYRDHTGDSKHTEITLTGLCSGVHNERPPYASTERSGKRGVVLSEVFAYMEWWWVKFFLNGLKRGVVVFGEIFIDVVLCGAKLNMVSIQWQFLSTWKVSQLTDENLKNVLKTGSFINAGNMNVSHKAFLIQYSKNLPPNWRSSINPFTVNNFAFWVWCPSKNSMESVWFSWAVWKCCIWELCPR